MFHEDLSVMPQVPLCDMVPSAARGTHARQKLYVLDLLELFGLKIVQALVVHPLPQQLTGGCAPNSSFMGMFTSSTNITIFFLFFGI